MKHLLNEKQLAEIINQSPRTLQANRLKGGGIPYIKLGRSVRYDFSEVEAYLAAMKRRSTADGADRAGEEG